MSGSLILLCELIPQIFYFEVPAGSRGACVSLDNGPPAGVIGTEDRLYRRCRRRFPPVPFLNKRVAQQKLTLKFVSGLLGFDGSGFARYFLLSAVFLTLRSPAAGG